METPVVEESGEARAKQEGVEDAGEDPGLCHFSAYVSDGCGEIPSKSNAKLNGICFKEVTDSSFSGAETTSDTSTTKETDDCIVDFLDKNNDEVYLSLSHPWAGDLY
jgi:hypothetical protein